MTISNRLHLAIGLVAVLLSGLVAPIASSPTAGAQPASFTFEGGGWGHGVGMSQYGAYGRAAAGLSHAEILAAYYQGTTVSSVASPTDLRVHLGTVAEVVLTPAAPLVVTVDEVGVTTEPLGDAITVGTTGTNFTVGITGPRCPSEGCVGETLSIPLSVENPVTVSTTGERYARGRIDILHSEDGRLHVLIAGLSMQDYLLGLAEMPQSWPIEALRSQAITGRSYAHDAVVRRRAAGTLAWDLSASTSDQAYAGYDQETGPSASNWIDAVSSTDNRVVTYQGAVVQTFYSSSNGGYSEDSGYVFATSLPYLAAAPDPFDGHENPNAGWERTYSTGDLSRWLGKASDTSVGTVTAISFGGDIGESGRLDKATITITGTGATKTVTGSRFRSVVNAGVRGDGGGRSQQLLSTKFRSSGLLTAEPLRPIGIVDAIAQAPGAEGDIALVGWALDGNVSGPTTVHAYVDGQLAGAAKADLPRANLGNLFPLHGPNHGFSLQVPAGLGRHDVCVYAINQGPGEGNRLLRCQSVEVTDHVPDGLIDAVADLDGTTGAILGWVIDLDVDVPVPVHVYVNGVLQSATIAEIDRPGVGAFFGTSPQKGFLTTFPVEVGTNRVCVYAINQGPGAANGLVDCRNLVVSDAIPFGAIDGSRVEGGDIMVQGWAVDADRDDPVLIHGYLDGQVAGFTVAGLDRPDVGAFFDTSAARGFDLRVPAAPGPHEVCVYALNAGPGVGNSQLGCVDITV